jgi:metallophosphoesterase superfamily enzyme
MQGEDGWLLTAARAAIHTPTATAVVSDLHLGYGEARRRGGEAVPAPHLAALLEPLRDAFRRHAVRRLVVAGDLFEAGVSVELGRTFLDWLRNQAVELSAVVPGNHDRRRGRAEDLLPWRPDGYSVGKWRVVHGDGEEPDGPFVQGHEHPCLRCSARLRAPCYLAAAGRLILPAYSVDAAGVNVLRRPCWGAFRCAVIVGEDVLDFGRVADLPARLRDRP